MKKQTVVLVLTLLIGLSGSVRAQLGQIGRIGQAKDIFDKADQTIRDMKFSDAEEQQLGADVSAKLRERYGVVQDEAVHKYVTLAGSMLAQSSARANLKWTFIVLDTDGINAFAAPGGFVHITRGALALIQNEAELSGVLGHEIGHVVSRHTIKAIQKSKLEGAVAKAATRSAFLEQMSNKLYEMTLENSFDRGDEMEADKVAAPLSSRAGYSPTGLSAFLTRLSDRNKGLTERSGIFASHPETQARIDELAKIIKAQNLIGMALVTQRYAASIKYQLVALPQLAPAGARAATSPSPTPARAGGSGTYGVGGMSALGQENKSSSTVASAGSRGVNPDRDARGGPNKALVVVTVTADEIAAFRKGIAG